MLTLSRDVIDSIASPTVNRDLIPMELMEEQINRFGFATYSHPAYIDEVTAEAILLLNPEFQREKKANNIKYFDNAFQNGEWDNASLIQFVNILDEDTRYGSDLQHRITSVTRTGARGFSVIEYFFPNIDAAKKHFASIDFGGQIRTIGQMLKIVMQDNTKLNEDELKKVCAAIRIWTTAFSSEACHGSRRLWTDEYEQCIPEFEESFIQAFNIIEEARGDNPRASKLLCSLPLSVVSATIHWTNDKNKTLAFWRGVAENNGLLKGDPRKVLADELYDSKFNIQTIKCYAMARKLAAAYNAFMENVEITKLNAPKYRKGEEKQPIYLATTPFAGRVHIYYEPGEGLKCMEKAPIFG